MADTKEAVSLRQLYQLGAAAKGRISRIYMHWTAGHYGQTFADYHLNIDSDGQIYKTCAALTSRKSHTWRRNTGSIGIALCCAYNATCSAAGKVNLGPEPPTKLQIEKTVQAVAVLTLALGFTVDFGTVTTHAEAACMDGYGFGSDDSDMRWDLLLLPDYPLTDALRPGGVVLRGKANWYRALYLQRRAQAHT